MAILRSTRVDYSDHALVMVIVLFYTQGRESLQLLLYSSLIFFFFRRLLLVLCCVVLSCLSSFTVEFRLFSYSVATVKIQLGLSFYSHGCLV